MKRLIFIAFSGCALFAAPAGAAVPIVDPTGDGGAGPDVVSVLGAFDASTLALTATFAPASFNPAAHAFLIGLDIDVNPATGVGAPAFFPLGAEFSVLYNAQFSTTMARVFNTVTGNPVALAPMAFGANTAGVSVPLALLAMDDGVMGYGAVAGNPISPDLFVSIDFAPNSANNGPLTNITKPVPAPSAALAILGASAVIAGARRRPAR